MTDNMHYISNHEKSNQFIIFTMLTIKNMNFYSAFKEKENSFLKSFCIRLELSNSKNIIIEIQNVEKQVEKPAQQWCLAKIRP